MSPPVNTEGIVRMPRPKTQPAFACDGDWIVPMADLESSVSAPRRLESTLDRATGR